MKVYKFGGASINSIERFQNTGKIISADAPEKLLVVVSAMGKTTNALEDVVNAFFAHDLQKALTLFEAVKEQHLQLSAALLKTTGDAATAQLKDFFTEIEWLLHDKPVRSYDYYYDQIVCCGEMFSTTIVYFYLKEIGVNTGWSDVRDIIRTDNNFRDAKPDLDFTAGQTESILRPLLALHDVVITQGFCGATDENESTTLGREGSDYSAAIFANLLDAESLTIWKDVESVMSADPRVFPEAVNMPALTFTEVIEMAFYGAQVIHSKTIKPLQNKNIPLLVKSFLNRDLPGTIINSEAAQRLPPVIVLKKNQVLMQFRSRDFSFIEGKPVEQLHHIFEAQKQQPNLSQNTAITLLSCFDDLGDKTDSIAAAAAELFDVEVEKGLSMITVRHYNTEAVAKYLTGKDTILEQRTPVTIQALFRDSGSASVATSPTL